ARRRGRLRRRGCATDADGVRKGAWRGRNAWCSSAGFGRDGWGEVVFFRAGGCGGTTGRVSAGETLRRVVFRAPPVSEGVGRAASRTASTRRGRRGRRRPRVRGSGRRRRQ